MTKTKRYEENYSHPRHAPYKRDKLSYLLEDDDGEWQELHVQEVYAGREREGSERGDAEPKRKQEAEGE